MDHQLNPGDVHRPVAAVRVWDLPTRLFHWLLVVLVCLQYASGKFGLFDMRWHFLIGYATLGLIVFRVSWGLVGSQTSRFSDFVRGPVAVARYVRELFATRRPLGIGHNPLGGWSVLALLLCLAGQAVTGPFASDDVDTDGPLVALVSQHTVRLMTRLHHWGEIVLALLIGLHVVAVLLYLLLRRENLIGPMLTGLRRSADPRPLRFASPWLALALLALCATLVAVLATVGG